MLHLHYRTAFRYRFYTDAGDIDADLQAWVRFYNFERPHRGYRTRGRRPAEIFYTDWGRVSDLESLRAELLAKAIDNMAECLAVNYAYRAIQWARWAGILMVEPEHSLTST